MSAPTNEPTGRRALLAGIGGLAAGTLLATSRSEAGPLNPPAAPASTPGPEPRIAINDLNTPGNATYRHRITQAGSYYLERNLIVSGGMRGIQIATNDVNIDLNGFFIIGSVGAAIADRFDDFIEIRNAIIRNGTIEGGIGANPNVTSISLSQTLNAVVEDVVIRRGTSGIQIHGSAIIRNCMVREVTSVGLSVGGGGTVSNCLVVGPGIGYILTDCVAVDCVAKNCGKGFTGSGNSLANCSAQSNTTLGIDGGFNSTIHGCTVRGGQIGIDVGGKCEVRNCVVQSCTTAGLRVQGGSFTRDVRIVDNTFHENRPLTSVTGVAILVGENLNNVHIEGNQGTGSPQGVVVQGTNCSIIRNAFGGFGTSAAMYSFAAGNRFGPLVKATPNGANVSVSGLSSNTAGSFGTTDPTANLFW